MNKSSYFIPSKALFGSYPDEDAVKELEQNGVVLFVNLTTSSEKLYDYTKNTDALCLHYPIIDRKIPTDVISFSKFIISVVNHINQLKANEKVYIHCKGGHGRAGVVVACLLCYIFKMDPTDALVLTTNYHSQRKIMRQHWRTIGSPQTIQQKNFVIKMFTPLHFYKAFKTGPTAGFSNFAIIPVHLECFEKTFQTCEAAFQAFKSPKNAEYIEKLSKAKTGIIAKEIGKNIEPNHEWYNNRVDFMTYVVSNKIKQNKICQTNLINSGLRPIIHHTRKDVFWGDGPNGDGTNMLGKILINIRKELYESYDSSK